MDGRSYDSGNDPCIPLCWHGSLRLFLFRFHDLSLPARDSSGRASAEGFLNHTHRQPHRDILPLSTHPNARFTILYSHGNYEDVPSLVSYLKDEYHGREYGVFAYDFPGYGFSNGKPT